MCTDSSPDVLLDLTSTENEGLELVFQTSISYVTDLRQQITHHEIDGSHCVALEFYDVHPVAARIDNYLSGTPYDSIGVTTVGLEDTPNNYDELITFRVNCTRNQLRRFALFNSVGVELPITFTVEVPAENADSFVRSVSEIMEGPNGGTMIDDYSGA